MKKITKHEFISMVIDYFGFTERSRKHIEEIYNYNGFYPCKSSRDVRICNYINGHVGDYDIED